MKGEIFNSDPVFLHSLFFQHHSIVHHRALTRTQKLFFWSLKIIKCDVESIILILLVCIMDTLKVMVKISLPDPFSEISISLVKHQNPDSGK